MSTYEVDPNKAVMPSVEFIYGSDATIVGETMPTNGLLVAAFLKGDITAEEYFSLGREEDTANQRLRDFMYGAQPPDFMPKIRQVARWRGWLKNIVS